MAEKDMKRILLISPFVPPNLGGIETHLEDLIDHLLDNGYRVTMLGYQPLSTNIKVPVVEKRRNFVSYHYPWFGNNLFIALTQFHPIFNFLYLTPYLLIRSFFFMTTRYREIDVVHVFGLSPAFIGRVLKFFFKKRTIMSFAALYDFKKENLFGKVCFWILKDMDHILVSSQDSKEDVLRLGLPREKVTIYIHWINLKKFYPGDKKEAKKKVGWQDKFTVLFVGRLIPEKGGRLLLAVARKTKQDIVFKFIGDDGPDLAAIKKEAEKKNSKVEYVGAVPNKTLPDYYRAANVFVYPALYQEDLARTIIEALACGIPVINTNPGSGIYKLKKEFSFVTSESAKEMQEKIELLASKPVLQEKMSQAAIKYGQKFGPRMAKKATDYY